MDFAHFGPYVSRITIAHHSSLKLTAQNLNRERSGRREIPKIRWCKARCGARYCNAALAKTALHCFQQQLSCRPKPRLWPHLAEFGIHGHVPFFAPFVRGFIRSIPASAFDTLNLEPWSDQVSRGPASFHAASLRLCVFASFYRPPSDAHPLLLPPGFGYSVP